MLLRNHSNPSVCHNLEVWKKTTIVKVTFVIKSLFETLYQLLLEEDAWLTVLPRTSLEFWVEYEEVATVRVHLRLGCLMELCWNYDLLHGHRVLVNVRRLRLNNSS